MERRTSSLLTFLLGAATGAVLGLLFAPDKGSNTRDKLTFMLDKYKSELQDLVDSFIESNEQPASMAREKGKKVISDAKQKAEKLLEDVDDLIDQIKGGND